MLYGLGRQRESIGSCERAAAVQAELDNSAGASHAQRTLAMVLMELGELDRAETHAATALDLARRSGGSPEQVAAWDALGTVSVAA